MSFEQPFENPSEDLPAADSLEQEQPEISQAASFERGFAWDSKLETVNEAEEKVRESLEALNWSKNEIEDIASAVRNAAENAVIHNLGIRKNGYKEFDAAIAAAEHGENGTKKVNMEIYASEREIKVVVTDEGDFLAEPKPVPGSASEDRSMMPGENDIDEILQKCDAIETAPGQITLIKYRGGRRDSTEGREF